MGLNMECLIFVFLQIINFKYCTSTFCVLKYFKLQQSFKSIEVMKLTSICNQYFFNIDICVECIFELYTNCVQKKCVFRQEWYYEV